LSMFFDTPAAGIETQKQLFQHVLDKLDQIVILTRRVGDELRIVYANPNVAQLGYNAEELVGAPFNFFGDTAAKTGALAHVAQGEPWTDEVLTRPKASEPRWFAVNFSGLDLDGEEYYLYLARDIHQQRGDRELRRRLEEQLLRSQKLESIGALASGVAHDFNNILTGIVGSTELVKMSVPEDSPAVEDLDNIVAAAQRAASLTHELLAYAAPNRSEAKIIDLNQMVTSILVILRSQMSRSIIVRKALLPDVPPVEADPVQIEQAMINLCLNASEAMREQGGILSIMTDSAHLDRQRIAGCLIKPPVPGTYAVFEVSDTGSGMDEDTRRQIFEPFFSTKGNGSGLGLTVVGNIVRAYRGGLELASEAGQGTTFRIFLPAATRQPQAKAEQEGESAHGTQTILFVDDEEILRSLGQRALERLGYRVLLAADGVEATRIFREKAKEIDLVILDLSMPRKGGEDTYQEIRTIRDDAKVLLCCGFTESIANTKITGKNLVGFLPKPFGIDVLAKTVSAALNK